MFYMLSKLLRGSCLCRSIPFGKSTRPTQDLEENVCFIGYSMSSPEDRKISQKKPSPYSGVAIGHGTVNLDRQYRDCLRRYASGCYTC